MSTTDAQTRQTRPADGDPMVLRPARVGDARPIAAIVNDYAEQGLMLHRSLAELYEHLRDYQVAERSADGRVVGVVGLRIMWANLAEIYSLAVPPEAARQGLGKRLVAAAVEDAERLGIRKLFTLTYERRFFERCEFEVVDRHQNLPLKVWSECVRCPKNQACDEIAMMRVLEHIPDAAPAEPRSQEADRHYELPVLSEAVRRLDRSARKPS
jgi:amino-acid N-acetyltransferase